MTHVPPERSDPPDPPESSEPSWPSPEVRTAAGVLRGSREAGVAVFRGIPFAEPPVGPLRFAAPRPVRGWDGVRAAVSYGPPPPQGGHFGMDALSREAVGDDWLTVNDWTPDPGPDAGLPVMVWIQGGAYTIGMSGLPEYDGGRRAREGGRGVVVVTFNYRVGLEGFGQLEGAPPNRGLLDLVLPFGLAQSGDKIVQPHALAVGLLVALLSAALPYSLELTALRRLPVRVVGVLQSLEPVAAGMAGLLLLQERLSTLQWLAIGLITAASAGAIAAHTGSHPPRAKQELTGGTSQSGHRLVSKPSSGVGTRSGSRASTRTRP